MALSNYKTFNLKCKLKALAVEDFERFCHISGVDLKRAFILLEKEAGRSNGEIAQALGSSRQTVSQLYQRTKKCK